MSTLGDDQALYIYIIRVLEYKRLQGKFLHRLFFIIIHYFCKVSSTFK